MKSYTKRLKTSVWGSTSCSIIQNSLERWQTDPMDAEQPGGTPVDSCTRIEPKYKQLQPSRMLVFPEPIVEYHQNFELRWTKIDLSMRDQQSLLDVNGAPAVLRNVCIKQWEGLDQGMRLQVHDPELHQLPSLLSFSQLHHRVIPEPDGAELAFAEIIRTPLEGGVMWVPGRSLWFAAPICNYAHGAEISVKLPRTLSFVGAIDQVLAPQAHSKQVAAQASKEINPLEVCLQDRFLLETAFAQSRQAQVPPIYPITAVINTGTIDSSEDTSVCFEELIVPTRAAMYVRNTAEASVLRTSAQQVCKISSQPPPTPWEPDCRRRISVVLFERAADRLWINAPQLCRDLSTVQVYSGSHQALIEPRITVEQLNACLDLQSLLPADIVFTVFFLSGFFAQLPRC